MIGLELDEAADVLDEALDALGIELMMAAKRDPFSRAGFDAMVAAVASEATRAMAQAQRDALRLAAPLLRRNWAQLDEVRLELAIAEVGAAMKTGLASGAPAVASVFGRAWSQTSAESWDASVELYGLRKRGARRSEIAFAERRGSRWSTGQPDPVFEGIDPEVADHARTASQFYIRDATGRIVDGPVAQAIRDKVAEGVRDGLDQRTIAGDIGKVVAGTTAARSRDYLVMASSVATARARSYGVLKSFEEALITTTRFVAVLDEVTSQVCRFMHGRTFQVSRQLQRFMDVARAPIGDVTKLQPFMRVGRTDDGQRGVGIRDATTKDFIPVATITRSGLGVNDDPGEFRALVSADRMMALGCCTPPLHPHCRSVLVPGPSARSQVPVSAPVDPGTQDAPAAAVRPPQGPTKTPGQGPALTPAAVPTSPSVAPALVVPAPWVATPATPDDELIETIQVRPGERLPPERPQLLASATPPNDRHFINRIRAGSRSMRENTVVLGSAVHDVSRDHQRIRGGEGTMVWLGDAPGVELDGRVYGWHPKEGGSLFPVRGSGFVTLTKPEYLALKTIVTAVKRGRSVEDGVTYALGIEGIDEADVAEALRVYRLRKAPR